MEVPAEAGLVDSAAAEELVALVVAEKVRRVP
jgi:hypothetical protein